MQSDAPRFPEAPVDPDPFTIGLGIFAAIAGGGAFLEARRQRELLQEQERNTFRSAWFSARRTLIHFKQQIDEFETYMFEDGYGRKEFRIGAVRLSVDVGRRKALRRLRGQTLMTANFMGDHLDELSDHLGPEYHDHVEEILARLGDFKLPETYAQVITLAREAFQMYSDLLDEIAEREGFELGDR